MGARICSGNLLVGLEAARFATRLGEEGDGDVEEFRGEGSIEGGHEGREGLFDGFGHDFLLFWSRDAMLKRSFGSARS